MKRTYESDKIRIFWDSDKCIHSEKCTGGLPAVFNPHRKPWIDINAADVEQIKRAIDACPSGALSYEIPGEEGPAAATIQVLKDGPYSIKGNCRLVGEDGEQMETGKAFALCRCGRSQKPPFCDGSHAR